jgi:hypothetical protein
MKWKKIVEYSWGHSSCYLLTVVVVASHMRMCAHAHVLLLKRRDDVLVLRTDDEVLLIILC